ncbi:MAG: hypothetical protein AB8C46_15260 [Burkholderiaceae bacterium]
MKSIRPFGRIWIYPAMAAAFALTSPAALAADAMTFKLGSWVCQTPEDYEKVTQAATTGGQSNRELQTNFKSQCVFMDDDNIEDMLPPFVTVLDTENGKAKVSFFVEFYKKLAVLEANIKHVRFVGWTSKVNVEPR